jgi:ribonuclease HI
MGKRESSPVHRDVLFADISMNSRLKCGVGGYLFLPAAYLEASPGSIEKQDIIGRMALQRFKDAGSTQMEIQTIVWALGFYRNASVGSCHGGLSVYTDSQCVEGLLRRRSGLENKNYIGKKTNDEIKNASLYRIFYSLYDELEMKVVKVSGHSPSASHDTVHRIFSIVDREVRKALRSWMDELKGGG